MMDANKLGLVVGLLLIGLALVAVAVGLTADRWTDKVTASHSRVGPL